MNKFLSYLKKKWNVGNQGLAAIMISFSLTGTTTLFVRPLIFNALDLTRRPVWLKTLVYPFIMVPVFYLLLLMYGSALGQRKFFWGRVKRMLAALIPCKTRQDPQPLSPPDGETPGR